MEMLTRMLGDPMTKTMQVIMEKISKITLIEFRLVLKDLELTTPSLHSWIANK
jgi:hypothetical protein